MGSQYSLRRDANVDRRQGTEEGKDFIIKDDILERCKVSREIKRESSNQKRPFFKLEIK